MKKFVIKGLLGFHCVVTFAMGRKLVASAKDLAMKDQWSDRTEFLNTTTSEYLKTNPGKFDLVVLNMILHEMNPDENYRRSVITDLYPLVKDDGMVILAEALSRTPLR